MATVKWFSNSIMAAFGPTSANPKIQLQSGGDNLIVTLHRGAVPNRHSVQYVSGLTNELANSGTPPAGYAQGTKPLPSQALSTDNAGTITFTGGTVTWTSTNFVSGSAPTYAVISDRTPGTAATQPVLALIDFVVEQTTAGGDFVIAWAVAGITQINFP